MDEEKLSFEVSSPEQERSEAMTEVRDLCQRSSEEVVYERYHGMVTALQDADYPYVKVERGGTLSSYLNYLKLQQPQFVDLPAEDFDLHYLSEYSNCQDPSFDDLLIHEGQIITIVQPEGQKPRLIVLGFESEPIGENAERNYTLKTGDTASDLLEAFKIPASEIDNFKIRVMDSEELLSLDDPGVRLESRMVINREGREFVIKSIPELEYRQDYQVNTEEETWYGVVVRTMKQAWHTLKGDLKVSADGGRTVASLDPNQVNPSEELWFQDNTFYLNVPKLVFEPKAYDSWRSVLDEIGLLYERNYPILKVQEVGTETSQYLYENPALPKDPVKLYFDPQSRIVYYELAGTEEPTEVPVLPTPAPVPSTEKRETVPGAKTAIERAAILKSDIPVLSYMLGADNAAITPQNRTAMIANALETMSGARYEAFSRKFGTEAVIKPFSIRYSLDKLDRRDTLINAVNTVVDGFKSAAEKNLITVCGGVVETKDLIMKLSRYETNGGKLKEPADAIRAFVFSPTNCRGYFQFNWANTLAFKVNPFNAVSAVRGIVKLMLQNIRLYNQSTAAVREKRTCRDFMLAAHNQGQGVARSGKRRADDKYNPEPYGPKGFGAQVLGGKDYTPHFQDVERDEQS